MAPQLELVEPTAVQQTSQGQNAEKTARDIFANFVGRTRVSPTTQIDNPGGDPGDALRLAGGEGEGFELMFPGHLGIEGMKKLIELQRAGKIG
jgi:hypothetical protein